MGYCKVLAHKKYRTGQFDGELASTYCRTAGHQLPRDGSNGLAKSVTQTFTAVS
jgi:hypothetical protein